MTTNFKFDLFNEMGRNEKNTDKHQYNCGGYALNTYCWIIPYTMSPWTFYDNKKKGNENFEKSLEHSVNYMLETFKDKLRIIEDLHELKECVTNIYAVEARASTFVIKEGKEEAFLKYYNENLKEHYDLLTKQEVIDNKLFGLTNDNKWLEALLGDYFLIAIGTYSFENFKFNPMIATHAGGTKEENLINLYVINK